MAPRKGNFSGIEKIFFFGGVLKNDISETEKFSFSRRPEKVVSDTEKIAFSSCPVKAIFQNPKEIAFNGALKSDSSET